MDADKLAYFGTIKTAHGDIEADFCIFFFFQGSLSFYNRDSLQCFIIRKSFSGMSMYFWANRFALGLQMDKILQYPNG